MSSDSGRSTLEEESQTLAEASVGSRFRITAVEGKACQKLRNMGFCEEMEVKKLSDGRNMVCTVCGIKLALNRKLADQVMVCPV